MSEKDTSPSLFKTLPQTVRERPDVLASMIDSLEQQVGGLKRDKPKPLEITTPVGTLPLPLALAISLWLAIAYPDKVLKFLGL
jgi:hypothetical protein